MAEIFLIRHPEAAKPNDPTFESLYGLSEIGRAQARRVGEYLMRITKGVEPNIIECTPSIKSHESAKLIAGNMGLSVPILEQSAFDHAGQDTGTVEEAMREWMFAKNSRGVYVATLSKRAIVAALHAHMDWDAARMMRSDDQDLPAGSVTKVQVAKGGICVDYHSMSAEEAAEFGW